MKLAAILLLSVLAQSQTTCIGSTCMSTSTWTKCTVTSSGSNLVVSGSGCAAGSTAKASALTQSIILFPLPALGYVQKYRIKTSTAFAGTTTLTAGLGTTAQGGFFLLSATGFNLNAAVTNTNMSTAMPLVAGSDTAVATNVVLSLTSTVSNISSVSDGVVDVWVLWSVIP